MEEMQNALFPLSGKPQMLRQMSRARNKISKDVLRARSAETLERFLFVQLDSASSLRGLKGSVCL